MDISSIAKKYNLKEVDKKLGNKFWTPIDVAYINDWVLRAAAVKGEFHWHTHEADEFFLIYRGDIVIDSDKGSIELKEGEGTVMPKGVRHKPRAKERAIVLLFEPYDVNTEGD